MNPADLFADAADAVNLSPGAALFHEGDAGSEMFILIQGIVDIVVGGNTVETAMRGALIGEMALIEQAPRAATVIAKTACRLARVDQRPLCRGLSPSHETCHRSTPRISRPHSL